MIEKMSEEEIIERLETSERTVEELRELLANSLDLVNQLHTKQREMQQDARMTKESSFLLAQSIAKYISLDTEQVAESIVKHKFASGDLEELIAAIKKNVESKVSDLGSGKVTEELVKKVVDHIDTDVIAQTIAEGNIEEGIAQYLSSSDIAYHIDVSDVAAYIETSDIASYVGADNVAGYIDEQEIASYIDLDDLAGHIDLDDLASKVKELMK